MRMEAKPSVVKYNSSFILRFSSVSCYAQLRHMRNDNIHTNISIAVRLSFELALPDSRIKCSLTLLSEFYKYGITCPMMLSQLQI